MPEAVLAIEKYKVLCEDCWVIELGKLPSPGTRDTSAPEKKCSRCGTLTWKWLNPLTRRWGNKIKED